MEHELITLAQMIEKLGMEDEGKPPRHVRYCMGTDPKEDNKPFNKRLFIGDKAMWLELDTDDEAVKAALEKSGYISKGETHVPDGFGRNYDSIYYHRDD